MGPISGISSGQPAFDAVKSCHVPLLRRYSMQYIIQSPCQMFAAFRKLK